ncbi:MAG: DNA-processing protein DprA [bacterium]
MEDIDLTQLTYLKLLLSIDGIGPVKVISLLNRFSNLEEIFSTKKQFLIQAEGINNTLAERIIASLKSYDSTREKLEKELNALEKISAKLICFWDKSYPELLKKIYYPPLILYTLGNFLKTDNFSIAIVGTRLPTNYGHIQTERFAAELAQQNITIVSGLARGIDSIAHKTSLKKGGRTIAVIGSGLDVIYPAENKKLFYEIIENGAIISEFELGTKPDAQNFPRRNRIISGISLGTLVIETRENGGAMQTASYALDQNREVFAIPGNIGSHQSEGTNSLIQRSEAKLVKEPKDLLIELGSKLRPIMQKEIPKPSIQLTLFEEKIFQVLSNDPKHIDDIAIHANSTVADCLVHLLSLEFKGAVRQLPGKMFCTI